MNETAALAHVALGIRLRRLILGALAGFVVWVLMTASLNPQELLAGALVSVLASLLATPHLAITDGLRLTVPAPYHLVRFLLTFFVALVRSNLDMARRVLDPALPINPALVTVSTRLHSDLGQLLLANSITLTPGTLSVDVEDGQLQVHWIDTRGIEDLELRTHEIAGQFERHLRGFVK